MAALLLLLLLLRMLLRMLRSWSKLFTAANSIKLPLNHLLAFVLL